MIKDALRIAELEQLLAERTAALIQRGEELSVINSVQEALMQEMDMQAIYDLVGDRIQQLFDAQAVIIATFDHEAGNEKFQYVFENGERFYLNPRTLDKLREHLIRTRQKVIINTTEEALDWFGKAVLPGTKYMQSGVFVPLISGEKVTGYVSLQNVDKENAFTASEIRLLETLSNSMSTALENARLLKETEQRTEELAVINSVQEALAKELDIQAIYDLVGNRIRELFEAQAVGIATFDHEKGTESIHYLIEKGERYYPAPRPLNILRKHLIQTKEKILINKNFEEVAATFGVKKVPGTEQPKSALYVPLVIGERVTGYISLQNIDKENAFSDSDVRLLVTLANSMGVALENARLFDETNRLLKETKQQKAELGVINSVQEGLAKELDIQAIYDLVGNRIRELFNAQAVIIATFDHETATEQFKYLIEDGQRFYLPPRPYDKLRQHLIVTRQKIVINSNYAEAYARFGLKTLPGTNMTKSGVFVPLITGDKINSYISLQNNEIENAFSESDIRLLETLANSMSVALENARLFDETTRLLKETEQRTAELSVINSVQDGLAKELEIRGIYELVGEKIRSIFNAQVIDIVTYNKATQLIEDRYTYEKGDRSLLGPRPLKGFRKYVFETARPLVINKDVDGQRAKYDQTVIVGEGSKSIVLVPMIAGGEVTGIISLQNLDQENAFSVSDVKLLTTLANSMSVALENARLFDETSRLLKETEQRTAELAVINSVQEGLAKELDIQGIYNLVGDRIKDLFNAQAVLIATFDYATGMEHFNYQNGTKGKVYPKPRPYDKLRQHLISTKQLILVNEDYEGAAAKFGLNVIAGTELPRSMLFTPLIIGDKVNGYVSLQNMSAEHAFSESDVRLLSTISNSMSVALESARRFDETNRLLKETEERTAELAVINSVQDGLAKELDMQGIYNLIGDRLCELFPDSEALVIRTFDHDAGIEHFRYAIENKVHIPIEPRPFIWASKHLINDRKPILINENYLETSKKYGGTGVTKGKPPMSAVFVPMIVGEVVKGSISLQNVDRENAFTQSDLRLLTTLTNSMSVALENARLFDETNRLLKETEQRTAELAVINSVQDGLAKELDMQGIYDLVGDRVQKLFHTHAVIIASFDLVSRMEHFNYAFEDDKKLNLGPRPINKLRERLIEQKQTIYIDTEEKARTEYGITAIGDTAMPKCLMFVPLLSGNNIKGYVSIQNIERENAFSEADINLLETLSNSMSVALENARLFDETTRLLKETEQRTAELAVINSVQEGLAKELDMQAIYDLVGQRIIDVFKAPNLVIRTFDHETGTENWRYAVEKGQRQFIEPKPFVWHSKLMIQTQKPVHINENYLEISKKHGGAGVFVGQPTKSGIFVPMIVGGVVRGSVSLQNVDKEFAYNEADLRLLTTITNSMSVALENARLFDETTRLLKETEQRTAELAVINSVQEGLAKELDLQGIYELVGDRLCSLFPDTQTLVIRTFDHESGMELWHYAKEKGERQYVQPRPFNWNSKLLIKTRKPLEIRKDYVAISKQHGGTGVTAGQPPKSALFVPMMSGDVVKGSVSLQNVDKENAFSDSDLRLLTTITNSMSVALENARLFDETSRLLEESKQQANELSAVNRVSQALASELNIDEIIKLVGDQMKDLFNANIVYLALLDKKTKLIHFPYQHGDIMPPQKFGEGLTSKVLQTGEPLLINKDVDVAAAELGVSRIGLPAASYLGVPIPVGDEVIGVLSVQTTQAENRFNENNKRLLSTIASSVGVALNKAQLFDEVVRSKQLAEEATKAAEKANEAKSAFLSTVSHELRTPLTSVLGFAKIIRKRLDEKIFPAIDAPDAKMIKTISQVNENLKVVISEGERLTNLINDVLDLAKIEAGKMEWNHEDVSMPEVAERAVAATAALFENKSLSLIKEIETDTPIISGDRDKLIQVIINLISNAVKFTDNGTVTCRLHHSKDEVMVSISDTGIGIAKEDYGAVFEQFKQVGGDTLTDKPKGTGLGLPICKEIVEHHGGRIWVESEVGKGSVFSFAIPFVKAGNNDETPIHLNELVKQLKEQMEFSKLKIDGRNSTILIVDDDDSIRSLLQQELNEAGYLTDEASNGKEALERIRNNKPDLVILDVMMPEINGFDVAAILKNDPQTMDIPIIMLSIVQDKARGFRIGVDRYLTKPIDTIELFTEVGSLLEQGKSSRKVMVVDIDSEAVRSLSDVLQAKGYSVVESDGKELVEKAVSTQPDIIILNSLFSDKQQVVQSLRFEKGLENVLFLIYQ